MRFRFKLFFTVITISCLCPIFTVAKNIGDKSFMISGGKLGDVPFPHDKHERIITDCDYCHNLYPQVRGSIKKYIDDGKFNKREVMDRCTKCHRDKFNAGLKTGPTRCKGCHIK